MMKCSRGTSGISDLKKVAKIFCLLRPDANDPKTMGVIELKPWIIRLELAEKLVHSKTAKAHVGIVKENNGSFGKLWQP